MSGRATVEDCIRLLALPKEERSRIVEAYDLLDEESRSTTYTYRGCSTKKCQGTVRVLRAETDNPTLCTECYRKVPRGTT